MATLGFKGLTLGIVRIIGFIAISFKAVLYVIGLCFYGVCSSPLTRPERYTAYCVYLLTVFVTYIQTSEIFHTYPG